MIKLIKDSYKTIIILLIVVVCSCSKEEHTTIPNCSFKTLECDMRQAKYSMLKIPGSFITVNTYDNGYPIGYAGLIIGCSAFPGFDNELVYYAYDSACPVEADRKVAVQILSDNLGRAQCPKCNAVYDLNNGGSPVSGSSYFLKKYKVIYSGGDILYVMGD